MAEALATPHEVMAVKADGIDQVVADPLRFKQRLRIGEDAYALLKAKNKLSSLWDAAGVAGTGAAVASSTVVANTFFAPTGIAAMLGLTTAATPVGWVIAAAAVTGGSYFGLSRWMSGKTGDFVDTIPKYITTPIDVLGAALMDLLGSLALRVSAIDGQIASQEIRCIADHLVEDWGFDATYVQRCLEALAPHADDTRVKSLAADLAQFQIANPDCNAPAMQAELMAFLRELVAADGKIDEREEMALEAIEKIFSDANRLTLGKAGEEIASTARSAGIVAGEAVGVVSATAKSVGSALTQKLNSAARLLKR